MSSRPSHSRDMPKSNWKTREGRPKGHAPAEGPWALTQNQCERSWQAKACSFFPAGESLTLEWASRAPHTPRGLAEDRCSGRG